jgi:hypothetical protein
MPPETKKVLLSLRFNHEGGMESSILDGATFFVKPLQSAHACDGKYQP